VPVTQAGISASGTIPGPQAASEAALSNLLTPLSYVVASTGTPRERLPANTVDMLYVEVPVTGIRTALLRVVRVSKRQCMTRR